MNRPISRKMSTPRFALIVFFVGCSVAVAATSLTITPVAPTIAKHVKGISQVYLAWGKVDGATSYNIYTSVDKGGAAASNAPILTGIVDTNTIVRGLEGKQGIPNFFAVRAVADGKIGPASAEVAETPDEDARLVDVVPTVKGGTVTLTWTSIGASSYSVNVGTSYETLSMRPDLDAVPGDSVTVQGLSPDVTYFFVVKASNGTRSDVVAATPRKAAPAVVALGANVNKASCIPAPGTAAAANLDKTGAPTTKNVSGADVFSKFATTATSGSTQATVQIVSGYVNAWMKSDPTINCGITNAISIEVSATAAVTTASFSDYARTELLGRRTGIVNLYFNPFAGRDKNNPYYQLNDRRLASDHIYIATPWSTVDRKLKSEAKDDSWDEALSFYSFGFGGRGIKTASTGNSLSAVGTTYVGYGVDGPFHDSASTGGSTSTAGGLSMEIFAAGNFANRNTLDTMFNTTKASKGYGTVGANLTLWATGKLFFSLEYDKGVGYFGTHVLKDATLFRFGYGNPTPAASDTKKPPGS